MRSVGGRKSLRHINVDTSAIADLRELSAGGANVRTRVGTLRTIRSSVLLRITPVVHARSRFTPDSPIHADTP